MVLRSLAFDITLFGVMLHQVIHWLYFGHKSRLFVTIILVSSSVGFRYVKVDIRRQAWSVAVATASTCL